MAGHRQAAGRPGSLPPGRPLGCVMYAKRMGTIGLAVLLAALAITAMVVLATDQPVRASSAVKHAAVGGVYCVTLEGGGPYPGCDQVFSDVQTAVDAATAGEIIKVAGGHYTGVNPYGGLSQLVYISKTVTIQGGYTTTDWIQPDPAANPAVLDAQGEGRVIYVTGELSLTMEGLRITGGDAMVLGGPWAWHAGGGVFAVSATIIISNNWISGNNGAILGGGLLLWDSHAEINGNVFTGNAAELYGGGGLALLNSEATATSNTISSNVSYEGGAVYLEDSVVWLISNTISNNSSTGGGGGLAISGGATTLVGNTVTSNTASVEGGGLLSWAHDVTLIGNTFTGNFTGGWGGGMCGYADTLIGNHFIANSAADSGGGLLVWYGETLVGNTFTGNTAGQRGGGLYGMVGTLADSTFTGNAADTGGGLALGDGVLSGNVVISNTATSCGGGLYLGFYTPTLVNNVVAGNHAGVAGGGLCIHDSSPRLVHTTIAGNTAGDGSGVYVTSSETHSSSVVLTNTILVGHSVGITVSAGNTATLAATLWGSGDWANDTDWAGPGTMYTGTVNVRGDPAFKDPGSANYHIALRSAAINAGLDATVATDIDGEPRPAGAGYDIGADEWWGPMIYLPLVLRHS